jgi:hypothetical protein
MSHSDFPRVIRMPPDAADPDALRRNVRPGTAVVRLETSRDRQGQGILDGAWWPRSRDIGAELPALVAALIEHLGPVTRVGLDAGAWEGLPTRLVVDDRVVHIDSFPVGDDTVLITSGERDLFSLLVIPPHAAPDAARAAMAEAVRTGNLTRAEQILIDTGTDRTRGEQPRREQARERRGSREEE